MEDDAGWQEVARYVHLNPVRVAALGLNKRRRAAGRAASWWPSGWRCYASGDGAPMAECAPYPLASARTSEIARIYRLLTTHRFKKTLFTGS